ncbi:MAG: LuxR family transcriptional regulator [Chitinophagaceae bacterium]|nr:MAG: LuxR family transcriptional regulator [Chitinophagaceae bacterium]
MVKKRVLWVTLYGFVLALLAGLMTWAKYRFLLVEHVFEIYGLIIAVVFVGLGIWMGLRLSRPKTIVKHEIVVKEVQVPVAVSSPADPGVLQELNVSERELEVLQCLARGLSNEEIASQLFISLNTVKTHLSNLYFKLEVKRRTQAVEKARSLGII